MPPTPDDAPPPSPTLPDEAAAIDTPEDWLATATVNELVAYRRDPA